MRSDENEAVNGYPLAECGLAVIAAGASSTCAHAQLTWQGSYAGDYRLYLQNEQGSPMPPTG